MAYRSTLCPPRHAVRSRALWAALSAFVVSHSVPALAQTSPAQGPLSLAPSPSLPAASADDIPLPDYLGLLRQIAPAAEDGARTYMAAARLRCGRELSTSELRRAMAQEGGDPVLMGLIRAAHQQNRGARQQFIGQVQCPRGGIR